MPLCTFRELLGHKAGTAAPQALPHLGPVSTPAHSAHMSNQKRMGSRSHHPLLPLLWPSAAPGRLHVPRGDGPALPTTPGPGTSHMLVRSRGASSGLTWARPAGLPGPRAGPAPCPSPGFLSGLVDPPRAPSRAATVAEAVVTQAPESPRLSGTGQGSSWVWAPPGWESWPVSAPGKSQSFVPRPTPLLRGLGLCSCGRDPVAWLSLEEVLLETCLARPSGGRLLSHALLLLPHGQRGAQAVGRGHPQQTHSECGGARLGGHERTG